LTSTLTRSRDSVSTTTGTVDAAIEAESEAGALLVAAVTLGSAGGSIAGLAGFSATLAGARTKAARALLISAAARFSARVALADSTRTSARITAKTTMAGIVAVTNQSARRADVE